MEDTVLANRYKLVAKLGDGAMGSVWLAEDVTLQRQVAVKLLKPAYAESAEAIERFQREARAAARLRSSHIITIHDYGISEKTPFIVMELLEGESLSTRLHREGALSPKTTADILAQVADALSVAHENGVIHRDLKPDNIFIVREREQEVVRVLDFGIAKTVDALGSKHGGLTVAGELLGTPYYMSPEQMLGQNDVGPGLDVWALGIIAYECLVGTPPLQGETVGAILNAICSSPLPIPSEQAAVPAGFDDWFARAAARELSQRFATADEAVRALRVICEPPGNNAPEAVAATAEVDSSAPSELPPVSASSTPEGSRRRLVTALVLALIVVTTVLAFRVLPRKGDLMIAVSTQGRESVENVLILVDGQKRCDASPCVVRDLLSGRAHFVRVRAPGYAHPADLPVTIKAGQEAHVNVRLLPNLGTATLRVTSAAPGLTLWLDGKEIGLLPQEIKDVTAGEHQIKVGGNSRYETHTETISLSENEEKSLGPLHPRVVHGLASIELGDNAEGAKVNIVTSTQRCEITRLPSIIEVSNDELWELVATKRGYADYQVPLVFDRGRAERAFRIDLRTPNEPRAPIAANAADAAEILAVSGSTLEAASHEVPTNGVLLAAAAAPVGASDAGSVAAQSQPSVVTKAETGTLNINSIPVANVLIDGRPLGNTPKLGVKVAAGKHVVVFVHPEQGRKTVTVDVAAGGTATAAVRFP